MRRPFSKLLFLLLALALLGALIFRSRRAITLHGFHWARLGAVVRDARFSLLLLSAVVIYLCYGIRALRWRRFCRYLGPTRFWRVYGAMLEGFSCIFLLGRAGEPIRPILIARKEGLPVSGMFGIYVLERLMDSGATAVLAGIALLSFQRSGAPAGASDPLMAAARTTGMLLLVLLAAAVGFFVYFHLHGAAALERGLECWRMRSGWRARVATLFSGFGAGLQAIRTPEDLAAAIGYTGTHWVLVALVYLWIPHAFGAGFATIEFRGAMLLLALTMVGSTLQLPGVGGGAQVATFLALTAIFGVQEEPAAAAAIVIWLITFASGSLVGVPLLLGEGWSMGDLRRMARAEEAAEQASERVTIGESSKPSGRPPR